MSSSTNGGAREEVELAGGDEQAEREQQGVAGQEREEQPALDEDDQQADPEQRRAEAVEQPVGVHPVDAEQHRLDARGGSRLQSQRVHARHPNRGPPTAGASSRLPRVLPCRTSSGRRTTRCRTARPRSASGRGRGRGPRASSTTPRCCRGRPPQRGRPLPLLDDRGDRGRPRHPPARLPRRHRELAARLQHRHDRAHRQRVPRRRGAHRRQPPLEPPRRDGDRPLPARPAPPGRRRPGGVPPRVPAEEGGPVRLLGIDNLPGSLHLETMELPRRVCFLFGQEGPGLSEAAREVCDGTFSIAQFGSTRSINACRGRGDRDARLGARPTPTSPATTPGGAEAARIRALDRARHVPTAPDRLLQSSWRSSSSRPACGPRPSRRPSPASRSGRTSSLTALRQRSAPMRSRALRAG